MKTVVQVYDAVTGDIITEREYLCRACAEQAVARLAEKLKERGFRPVKQTDEEWVFEKDRSQVSILIFEILRF